VIVMLRFFLCVYFSIKLIGMKKYISAAVVVFLLYGCSSSRLISSWRSDKPYQGASRVLVLGLTGDLDREFCVKMEQHLVNDLNAAGYNASTAYDQFGPQAFKKMDEKTALSHIQGRGFDAVITIVLLNQEKETYYVPRRIRTTDRSIDPFWDYYTYYYERVLQQGYYATSTKYFWESNYYDLVTNTLVYTSQTQSFDPLSAASLGHEYGKIISKDMLKKGIIPATAKKPF
jgi:hypothetical protein